MHIPPHLSLANTPTRIDQLPRLSAELGVNMYVKRDDQTGSEISGNKIRKLEFVLKDTIDKGCDMVITCGGLQSNHARSTAAAAVRLGLSLINQLLGAEFRYISEEEYRNRRGEIMEEIKNEMAAKGRKAYIIPEGASDGLGCFGYYNCFHEIAAQEKQLGLTFDTIVTAVGSGGTYGGLFIANKLTGAGKRIAGFNVCDTAHEFQERITAELHEMLAIGRTQIAFTPGEIDIIDGYVGIGYAQSRKEELDSRIYRESHVRPLS